MAMFQLPSTQTTQTAKGKDELEWINVPLEELPTEFAEKIGAILEAQETINELRKQIEPVWIEFCKTLPANHESGCHIPAGKTMKFSYKYGFGCAVANGGKVQRTFNFKSVAPTKKGK